MKIAYDGKRTTQNHTGLGNYGRYIIGLLKNYYPENKYIIYALKAPEPELAIEGVKYQFPQRNSIKFYWRSHGLVKDLIREKISLFHGLSNEIPFGLSHARIKSVVTIHDLIFLRFPGYYSLADRLIYKFKFRHAALKADKIIAISEQTKSDIIHFFGIPEHRIKVIYQNCDSIFHKTLATHARQAAAEKYKLPARYILNVGTIEERKNLMLIVKTLPKINDIHLVVVGKRTKYTKSVVDFITQNKLLGRVHFLHNVAFADLPAIYQGAELFIYPSRFEGFGIPIIEALHSGIPVIAAKGSCLEEAGGPGSIYVNPDDEVEMAFHIKHIIQNEDHKVKMVAAGKQYLEKFENKKIARQIRELYQNIVENA